MNIEVFYEQDAGKILADGIERLEHLLKPTYGPMGSKLIMGNPLSVPILVGSGNGIIQEVDLGNPGTELAKESIVKLAETEGDGTTTALLMMGTLTSGCMKATAAGINSVRLRQELKKEADRIQDWLIDRAKPVKETREALRLTAGLDEEERELINRAFQNVTEDGIITVRDAKGCTSYVEQLDCMEIDQGYLAEEMITEPREAAAYLERPLILLTDQVISQSEQVVPVMNLAKRSGRPLFLMAQDVTGEALATLILNNKNGKLSTVAVKATAYGERRKEILWDMAAATGAMVVTEDFGDRLEQIMMEQLGSCEYLKVTAGHTYLYGGKGRREKIQARAEKIRRQMVTAIYEVDRVNLKNRLARLEGGVSVIYVGADTQTEMRDKRHRIKRAVAHVKAIMRLGAVEGGGISLLTAADQLYREAEHEPEETKRAACLALREMLTTPFTCLLGSIQCSPWGVTETLKTMPTGYGFDVVRQQYGDMFQMGIVDAAGTLCRAVETAVSLSGLVLTAGAVVKSRN